MNTIPKRLAVDFDDTLFHAVVFPHVSRVTWMNKLVHAYVKYKKKQGWFIIINTRREEGKGLDMVRTMCELYKIPYDIIYEQEPNAVAKWGMYRTYDLSIDNTNIGFIGWMLRHFG